MSEIDEQIRRRRERRYSPEPWVPMNSTAGCKRAWMPSAPAPHAELLHVLMLPDFDRVDRISSYWGNPATRSFAELLIDCEEDRTVRAVLVGMLRDRKLGPPSC